MERSLSYFSNEDVCFGVRWIAQDSTPYDVSAAYFTVKRRAKDTTNIFQATLGNGLTKEAVTFWITLFAEAGTFQPGAYRYDFSVVRAVDQFQKSLMDGELEIKQGVGPSV